MDSKTDTRKDIIANLTFNQVFMLFLILAFILRFFSFFPSLIDHDESTYLIIAKEILKGKVLYADVTDIKPVGIFYITAGFIKLFGDSIFGYRVFGTFIIALTSLFLYFTRLKIGHSKEAAFATGIIYIFFLSVWTQYGVPLNTEHFFNLFTALAILILFSVKANWRFPAAGLILGIGFLIKIVVAFDFTAIFLFLIISDIINQKISVKKIGIYFLSGILFLIPFGIVNLAFYKTGHFSDFSQINYDAFGNYPRQKAFWKAAIWIFDFFVRFLPLSVFFFWSLFSRQKPQSIIIREKLFIITWIAFCLVSVLLPGTRFSHYLIQLMLPLSYLAGNIFDPEFRKPHFIKPVFTKKIGFIILLVLIAVNVILQKKDYYDKIDCPRQTARYLSAKMEAEDILYTGNAQHIIYFLLDKTPPTKYVHPSLILGEEHNKTLGIDRDIELLKIMNKTPEYILIHDTIMNSVMNELLEKNYTLIKSLNECRVKIYQSEKEK